MGIPGWDSVASSAWWSGLYFWLSICALISLGIFEVASHRYSDRKDELAAAEQEAIQRRHDDEMARLHLETAKANERAAELNTALEKEREKTSPRTWKKEQFDAIQSIRGMVTDVGILVQKNCLECFMFANYLELALHQEGVRLYSDDSLPTGQLSGIALYLPQAEMEHWETNHLVIAMRAAELNPLVIRHNPPEFSQMRTDIPVIVIGEKSVFPLFEMPFFPSTPPGTQWTRGPLRKQ